MFKTVQQAEAYFASIAFYNRHIGEIVVATCKSISMIGF